MFQLARGSPAPRQKFVKPVVGPEIDRASKDVSKPRLGVDAGQLGGLIQRGENGPVFGGAS